jgi:hypothetical protein
MRPKKGVSKSRKSSGGEGFGRRRGGRKLRDDRGAEREEIRDHCIQLQHSHR